MSASQGLALFAILIGAVSVSGATPQAPPQGVTYTSPGGTRLRLILDDTNIGSEMALGEMTFPANSDSGDHRHEATEIFYVISGELQHIVNGNTQLLKAGMSGFVKPPDLVRHKVGPEGPAKVVVIWMPGAEAKRITSRWKREP